MKRFPGFILLVFAAFFAVRIALMAVLPVFEPSEARYAAISANMARTGDWLVPRFTYKGVYRPFSGKPPLVFQASAAATKVLGIAPFAVRVVPFASFLALLALAYAVMKRLDGKDVALASVMAASTSTALYATAGLCMTDVPLALATAGALFLYASFRERPSVKTAFGIGFLLGVGMLVKGPVSLALFGLAALADAALNKRWRTLFSPKLFAAIPVFLAVASPWFVMMHRADPGFLKYFFINENLLRFLVKDYGDRYGAGRETFRGMAVVWAFVTVLPWSLLPLKELFSRGPAMPRRLPRDFFLVSALAITLFWSLTSRVPLAYLLPAAPLYAAWIARRYSSQVKTLFPWAALISAAVVALVMASAYFFSSKMPGRDAEPKVRGSRYSYEFYHGPWGEGAPK